MIYFGELKKGDLVYFYSQSSYDGPGDICQFCLDKDPDITCEIVTMDIQFNEISSESPFIVNLEFHQSSVIETIDLDDYNTNYLRYGSETFVFSTNLSELEKFRRSEIKKLIKVHMMALEKLMEKQEKSYDKL